MKTLLYSMAFIVLVSACSKSNDSPGGSNNDNSIKSKVVNIKWNYDSTVIWNYLGFMNENYTDFKTYILFDDQKMTDYEWNGTSYDTSQYPCKYENQIITLKYFETNDTIVLRNNQLVLGESSMQPRQTNTTGEVELLWNYYHR